MPGFGRTRVFGAPRKRRGSGARSDTALLPREHVLGTVLHELVRERVRAQPRPTHGVRVKGYARGLGGGVVIGLCVCVVVGGNRSA